MGNSLDIKKIIKSERMDVVVVVAVALFLYVFSTATCVPRGFSDDDWGIANYFVGTLGAEYATPYNKFINFVWGWIMYAMYQLVPGPNWFIIIQEVIVVLSFSLLQYILIQKLKTFLPSFWCYLLTSVLMMSFEPAFICRLQFTQTAAIGTIAGAIWMIWSYKKGSTKGYWVGCILMGISALHRFGPFLMCLPFVGVMIISVILHDIKSCSFKRVVGGVWDHRKLWYTVMCLFVLCLVLSKVNSAIYNSDYYAEYNAFNLARASVLDYPKASYDDIAEGLEKIGVSANDYSMMTSWTFADRSFFTTELFEQVAALEPKTNAMIDYSKEIQDYFERLLDPTVLYNKLFYMALIIITFCLIIDFKHMIFFAPIYLGGAILIELYLTIIVKRYPSYCRTGLLFVLITCVLVNTDFSKIMKVPKKYFGMVSIALSAAILIGLAPLGNDYYLTAKGTFEYNMDGLAMQEYLNSRGDDVFMVETGSGSGLPALRDSYSIFEAIKPGIMWHCVGLGGWSTNIPWMNEAFHSWGIDYPLSQSADDNVYLIASSARVDTIRTYLREHHNMETSASLSAVEYGTTIWKLTNNDLDVKEVNGTGSIKSIECTYDETYNVYDLTLTLSTEGVENGRVYVAVSDEAGIDRYFMAFNGNDMNLSSEGKITAKIPVSYIEDNTEYAINVIVQKDGVNRLICKEDSNFSLAKN